MTSSDVRAIAQYLKKIFLQISGQNQLQLIIWQQGVHNFENIIESFQSSHKKPKIIIAHTVKGKGISFMEDKLEWHYKSPNEYQYKQALDELG